MKKMMLFGSMVAVLSITACAKSTPTPAPTGGASSGNQSTAAVDAQSVYKQNCMSCHGTDLSGGIGPNLQKVGAKLSTDQITNQISNGGGGMPPFKSTLKPEDINALAQWLAANK